MNKMKQPTGSMDTFARLEEVRRSLAYDKRPFAMEVLGLGPDGAQNYDNWRKRGVPLKQIVPLALALRCSADWLAHGRGERPAVLDGPHGSNAILKDATTPGPDRRGLYPLLGRVPAGEPTEAIEAARHDSSVEYLPSTVRASASSFFLRVTGESMEPEIMDGSLILVDPELVAGHGDIVVARNGSSEANVKKLVKDGGEWYLVPHNPRFQTKPLGDSVIVGVVRAVEKVYR